MEPISDSETDTDLFIINDKKEIYNNPTSYTIDANSFSTFNVEESNIIVKDEFGKPNTESSIHSFQQIPQQIPQQDLTQQVTPPIQNPLTMSGDLSIGNIHIEEIVPITDQNTSVQIAPSPVQLVQSPQPVQPATQQPSVQLPATQQPSVQLPATQQPSVQLPATQQPSVQLPATQQPSVQSPSVQQPQPVQPATQQPEIVFKENVTKPNLFPTNISLKLVINTQPKNIYLTEKKTHLPVGFTIELNIRRTSIELKGEYSNVERNIHYSFSVSNFEEVIYKVYNVKQLIELDNILKKLPEIKQQKIESGKIYNFAEMKSLFTMISMTAYVYSFITILEYLIIRNGIPGLSLKTDVKDERNTSHINFRKIYPTSDNDIIPFRFQDELLFTAISHTRMYFYLFNDNISHSNDKNIFQEIIISNMESLIANEQDKKQDNVELVKLKGHVSEEKDSVKTNKKKSHSNEEKKVNTDKSKGKKDDRKNYSTDKDKKDSGGKKDDKKRYSTDKDKKDSKDKKSSSDKDKKDSKDKKKDVHNEVDFTNKAKKYKLSDREIEKLLAKKYGITLPLSSKDVPGDKDVNNKDVTAKDVNGKINSGKKKQLDIDLLQNTLLTSFQHEVQTKSASQLDEVNMRVNQFQNVCQQEQDKLQTRMNNLQQSVNTLFQEKEQKLNKSITHYEKNINDQESRLSSYITDQEKQLQNAIQSAKSDIDKYHNELTSDVEDKKQQLLKLSSTLQGDISKQKEELETLERRYQEYIKQQEEKLDELWNTNQKNYTDRWSKSASDIEQDIKNVLDKVEKIGVNISKNFNKNMEQCLVNMNNQAKIQSDNIDSKTTDNIKMITDVYAKQLIDLERIKQQIISEMNTAKSSLLNTLQSERDDYQNYIDKLSGNTSSNIRNELSNLNKELVKNLKQEFETCKSDYKKTVKNELENAKKSLDKYVSESIKDLQKSEKECYNDLKNYVSRITSSKKKEIDDVIDSKAKTLDINLANVSQLKERLTIVENYLKRTPVEHIDKKKRVDFHD